MNAVECLRNVVGISDNECVCFDEGKQAEYTTSLSGYFLDDSDYGFPLTWPQAIYDCEHNDLWQQAYDAREQGIRQLVTEYGAAMLSQRYMRKENPWRGTIGVTATKYRDVQALHGLKLTPARWRGVEGTLTKVTVYGDQVGPVPVTVEVHLGSMLDIGKDEPIFTGSSSMAAGQAHIPFTAPVRFSLTDPVGNPETLYIVVRGNAGDFKPADTTLVKASGCGSCGSKSTYKSGAWTSWMQAAGVEATDISTLTGATEITGRSMGISADISLSCGMTWLCQPFDWVNDEWARVFAELIVLYSNRVMTGLMLRTDKANVYTSARSEEIVEMRTHLDALIQQRLEWAVEQLPHDASSCYSCRKSQRKRVLLA